VVHQGRDHEHDNEREIDMTAVVTRYHPLWVAAHWLTAILIAISLFGGITVLRNMPNTDPEKIPMPAAHAISGIVILLLLLTRLLMRWGSDKPPPVAESNPWLRRLRKTVHVLLYVIAIAMVSTGLGMVGPTGVLPVLFGAPGQLPADFWEFAPRQGHFFFSRLLLSLVLLHIAAALYHQFVRRDSLLRRMWFGRRRAG